MKNINLPKILFYANIIAIPLVISFSYGLYSATSENWVFVLVRNIKNDVATVILEVDNLTKTRPKYFLRPARYDGSGVTVNKTDTDSEELIFISGFFEDNNELRLIRRNGEIVARWIVEFSEIFPDTSHLKSPPSTDWNIEIHGALALSDGSVVFNFQIGGLVKLDRCGDLVWKLPLPAHHSVELAEDGGFWVPGLNFHDAGEISPFPPFRTPFREDTIMKISDDGVLISEISIPKLFFDNDLDSLLTSTGESFDLINNWDNELVHLNKIAELKSDIADDFPLFQAGDLMLSIRQYNMVFVVDPVKNLIKWWQIGPWKRQHDPEFSPGGKIIVFNNNIYKTPLSADPKTSSQDLPRVSNVIEFDPSTGNHRVIYGNSRDQELLTVIRGKHELMPHGGLLITESQGGRVLETDGTGQIIWEYINRYDDNDVAILTEARVYPANYFSAVTDWACKTEGNRLGN